MCVCLGPAALSPGGWGCGWRPSAPPRPAELLALALPCREAWSSEVSLVERADVVLRGREAWSSEVNLVERAVVV